MKIKITNWDKFEKVNAIYFTRDLNISDIIEILAVYQDGSQKVMLTNIDFYWYKTFGYITEGDYYIVIDESFNEEYVKLDSFVSTYEENNEFVRLKMKNLVAKKWMIENKSFFAMVWLNSDKAEELFFYNEFKNN